MPSQIEKAARLFVKKEGRNEIWYLLNCLIKPGEHQYTAALQGDIGSPKTCIDQIKRYQEFQGDALPIHDSLFCLRKPHPVVLRIGD